MTEERDGEGRARAQPDLLASLPEERAAPASDPAAVEELLAEVRSLGERLDRRQEAVQAERPAPVTREALDAWGKELVQRVVKRVVEAAQPADTRTDDGAAAIASHVGKIEGAVARTEAAAQRIEGGLERTTDRFAAEVKGMEEWLAEDRSKIRATTAGIESAAARIETDLGKIRNNASQDSRWVTGKLEDIKKHMAGLRFGWRVFLAPWIVFVFILGMIFERRGSILSRLLGALW